MLRSDFINLPEWQIISAKLAEWIEQAKIQSIESVRTGNPDFIASRTAYVAGCVDAYGFFMQLPEQLFGDGPKDEPDDAIGILKLKNHPRESRVF